MQINDKQLVALIETNQMVLNELLAEEAKLTAVLNINAVMIEGLSKKEIKKEDVHRLCDAAFEVELKRLREAHQKKMNHIVQELKGEESPL